MFFFDFAAHFGEAVGGFSDDLADFWIDGGVAQVWREGHAQSFDASLHFHDIISLVRPGEFIARISAAHDVEHQCGVADGASDRTGMREGLDEAGGVLRHQAKGGF